MDNGPRDHRNNSTDNPSPPNTPDSERERSQERDVEHEGDSDRDRKANPPHTTTDGVTAPKFGSASSGGGEYEPAPGT